AAQFLGVLTGDLLVTALPDHDRGMVAEINDHVAPAGSTDFPGGADRVGFTVEAGLFGHDAEPIAGLDHRLAGRAVAPADPVAARLLHQFQRVEMHPVGLSRTKPRPFVGGLLAPAVELHMMAVNIETRLRIPAHSADAIRDFLRVDDLPAGNPEWHPHCALGCADG